VPALQADGGQHRVEQAPGLADEGLAPLVLLGARAFADEQPVGLAVAHAGHGLLAALAQHTAFAAEDARLQGVPAEAGQVAGGLDAGRRNHLGHRCRCGIWGAAGRRAGAGESPCPR
jgi:hypothetical protein